MFYPECPQCRSGIIGVSTGIDYHNREQIFNYRCPRCHLKWYYMIPFTINEWEEEVPSKKIKPWKKVEMKLREAIDYLDDTIGHLNKALKILRAR